MNNLVFREIGQKVLNLSLIVDMWNDLGKKRAMELAWDWLSMEWHVNL
jgi:hypothetical protein